MGILDGLVRALLKVFCASPPQEAPEPAHPSTGKPPYAQQPQQPVYPAQYQYPPQQQPQWRPPQPPVPAHSQQQQHPDQSRPHKHKPHHSHEYHAQGQGPHQVAPVSSPHAPVAVHQNQWASPPSSPPQHAIHPSSSPPTHVRVVSPTSYRTCSCRAVSLSSDFDPHSTGPKPKRHQLPE